MIDIVELGRLYTECVEHSTRARTYINLGRITQAQAVSAEPRKALAAFCTTEAEELAASIRGMGGEPGRAEEPLEFGSTTGIPTLTEAFGALLAAIEQRTQARLNNLSVRDCEPADYELVYGALIEATQHLRRAWLALEEAT